ncbi:MAG TPA: aspartate kinase [Bacteroidales bacterium]|nr:aspartate kinase [Bacteroidales bacterium]HPS62188.1 aspartate kinase [Bacteroidales bacterium]
MHIDVFKFGGASVNSAEGVRRVASILSESVAGPVVVVVSAMGKTTNALERLLDDYRRRDPLAVTVSFEESLDYHMKIVRELFPAAGHPVYGEVESFFDQLRGYIRRGHLYREELPDYDFDYDQIVCYGELISSCILHHYLVSREIASTWFDVRELIRTDATNRDARVDWKVTADAIREVIPRHFSTDTRPGALAVTQGFIGSDPAGNSTTLGREGSDFSAAVFAWCLHSKEMTIWKDVPGVMNADPRWMPDAVLLDTLSYREAIELAYYGASVIHPKTIKPLENAGIRLRVRSFLDPALPGTQVLNLREWSIPFPIFIRKQHQMLISVSPRDFSFILEENLSEIFRILADFRVKVNVMQNSAISFSVCVDTDRRKVDPLIEFLRRDFEVRYNDGLELFTIRHYTEEAVSRMTKGKKVILELRSRGTVQVVVG